jgi:hypothetical protein
MAYSLTTDKRGKSKEKTGPECDNFKSGLDHRLSLLERRKPK